jgi:hypothetical protein
LNNCGFIRKENNKVSVSQREILTPDETNYTIILKHKPVDKLFIYNQKTGEKIENFSLVEGTETTYRVNQTNDNVIVDYEYL